jgi:peptide/nickel transport system substrate-binding protein
MELGEKLHRGPPAVAAIAAVVGICAGCAQSGGVHPNAEVPTLTIGVATPARGLDVGIGQLAALLTNESLVTVGPDGRATPRLAERWESSADGLTWRFTLRDQVRFHDGSSLTADVVRDLLRARMREGSVVGPSFRDVTDVQSEGDRSLVIRLGRHAALLLPDLVEVDVVRGSDGRVVATGPFSVDSQTREQITLRRFREYRGGTPSIERAEIRSYATVRSAWSAMMRGEVDFLYEVGPDAAEFVDSESSVQTFSFLRAYTLTMGFNVRHPILRSRVVRQALNRAVDREAIVESVFRGRGRVASGPIWPNHWTFSSAVPTYSYNREAAELGFAAAGYRALEENPGRMPSRFTFKCLVYAPLERVALLVQKQLFEVGVNMTLELVDVQQLADKLSRSDYDAFLFWLLNGRSLTWPYLFWHSPPPHDTGLMRSGYTAADGPLDQIRYARNDSELRDAVAAFQQVMHDDPPAIFLAWTERLRAVSKRFYVPHDEPGRDIVSGLWRWRLAATVNVRTE